MHDVHARVELLPVSLLGQHRQLVQEMQEIGETLGLGLGWHYLLDLPWAAHQLHALPGTLFLDAGAGRGAMQWWLAEQGVDVISVDRVDRSILPRQFLRAYRVRGLRDKDLARSTTAITFRAFLPPGSPRFWATYPSKVRATLNALLARDDRRGEGTVYIYNQDLRRMADVASESIDAVVSISALEHNHLDDLRACVPELMRVLKPGGKLVATLAGAKDEDWYHEPSKGWCYTEATLREIFQLPDDCPSNYDRYDELFTALCQCTELRDNLADFYFRSGDNGMPWGVWDPKYQPVGVVKVKPLA